MSASRCRRRPAGGTRGTFASCPPGRVLSAAGRRPTRIIFVLQSRALSAAKSATNSLCRSAALTTALFTRQAMNAPGGTVSASTLCRSHRSFGVSAVDQRRLNAQVSHLTSSRVELGLPHEVSDSLGFENITMQRPRSLPHCKRRAIPRRLKIKILLRQEGRCADCGAPMIAMCVFDHRPPLALRDVGDNPNDPALLAAICHPCNKRKTVSDLRAIARARRAARSTLNTEAMARDPRALGYGEFFVARKRRHCGHGPALALKRALATFLLSSVIPLVASADHDPPNAATNSDVIASLAYRSPAIVRIVCVAAQNKPPF